MKGGVFTSFTVDGEAYDAIKGGILGNGVYVPVDATIDTETNVDLYLINDYAAAVVPEEVTTDINYGVLLQVANTQWGDVQARILTADGSVLTATIDEDELNVFTGEYVGYIIAYSVDEEENTVSSEEWKESVWYNPMPEMTAKGKIAGKTVSEEVTVFDYTGGDYTKAKNYDIYDYAALEEASGIEGYFVTNEDNEIVAIYSVAGVSAKETFLAFYASLEPTKDGSTENYDVTVLTDGVEKTYATKDRSVFGDYEPESGDVVAVTIDAKKVITKIEYAEGMGSMDPVTSFGDYDYAYFDGSKWVDAIDDTDLTMGNYTINVEGAAVYKMVDGVITADDYSLDDIEEGMGLGVCQLSEDSDTWDAIVILGNPR
jgi:hypothetical protein